MFNAAENFFNNLFNRIFFNVKFKFNLLFSQQIIFRNLSMSIC